MTSMILILTATMTATLSATLGMVGGAVLLWVCLVLLPVGPAMVLHGLTQAASNGARAALLARHIRWRVLLYYSLGAGLAALAARGVSWLPDRDLVYICLGLFPWVGLLIGDRLGPRDITSPRTACIAGVLIAGLQSIAGVSGPLLDLFFQDTPLSRQEVVATKAATQWVSHLAKILVFWPTLRETPLSVGLVGGMWAATLVGTLVGGSLLQRLDETRFRLYGRTGIQLLGLFYLVNGVIGLAT